MSSKEIGIEEARKVLGDLVTAVQQGTSITITRNGRPAARLVAHTPEDTMAYTEMLHRHPTAPWADDYAHEHQITVEIAHRIATDIVRNRRGGAGDQFHVYDVSGDETVGGWYVGNLDDGAARSRINGGTIVLDLTYQNTIGGLPSDGLVENVYRAILPKAGQWLRLRSYLAVLIKSGRIEADENVDEAAGRMVRRGYTVDTLIEELR